MDGVRVIMRSDCISHSEELVSSKQTCVNYSDRAPAFVIGEEKKVDLDKSLEEGGDESGEVEGGVGNEDEETIEASPVPDARVDQDAGEERPRMGVGSLESGAYQNSPTNAASRGGIGSRQAGLGSSATEHREPDEGRPRTGIGGLGSAARLFASASTPPGGGIGPALSDPRTSQPEASPPNSFGSVPRQPQRSFLRDGTGSSASSAPGTPKLSYEEKMHFNKLHGSFGAKLMAKMGWQAVSLVHHPLSGKSLQLHVRVLVWVLPERASLLL